MTRRIVCAPCDAGIGCVHHWRIATPDGAASLGRCRLCGLERLFANVDAADRPNGDGGWRVNGAMGGGRRRAG